MNHIKNIFSCKLCTTWILISSLHSLSFNNLFIKIYIGNRFNSMILVVTHMIAMSVINEYHEKTIHIHNTEKYIWFNAAMCWIGALLQLYINNQPA